MPFAAARLCSAPGCPAVAVVKGRCQAHMRVEYRRVERYRGTAKSRGYGEDWQRVRKAFLRDHRLCVLCEAEGVIQLAHEIDHVTPLAEGGSRLDVRNLQALCRLHHAEKTGAEHARRRA